VEPDADEHQPDLRRGGEGEAVLHVGLGAAGEGGGGGGDGNAGDGGSSTEPSRACQEASEVLGYSRCAYFGAWEATRWPALTLGFGLSVRHRPLGDVTLAGEARHDDDNHPFMVRGEELGEGLRTYNFTLHVGGRMWRWGTWALEGGFGGGATPGPTLREGAMRETPTESVGAYGVAVLGVRVPIAARGRVLLRAELASGGSLVSLGYRSSLGACESDTAVTFSRLIVEARVSVEVFTGPWTSLVATVSSDVMAPGQVSLGVQYRLHARAFDALFE
jgi:hypothetical protein